MGDLVPRQKLVNQVLVGAGGIIGGILTLSLGGIPGIVIGAAAAVIGLVVSAKNENKLPGLVAAGAGAVLVLANLHLPIISGLTGFLIGVSGIALIALGGFSLFKFFKNMKDRT